MKLKVVADQGLHGLDILSQHELTVIPGREIDARDIKFADALLVRSVTNVNEELLQKAKHLAFVGTATIGTDHISFSELKNQNIAFAYAPGCNANAVVDYVLSVLLNGFSDEELTGIKVGVAGYGNVGSRLAAALKVLDINYQVYDPLLEQQSIPNACGYREFLQSDIFSLHVPLTTQGDHATRHWFSHDVFAAIQASLGLINTSRGEVIEQEALLSFLDAKNSEDFLLALDVWPNEPAISSALLSRCRFASPHIAGHSVAGKLRGSLTIFKAMAKHFKCELNRTALANAEAIVSEVSETAPWATIGWKQHEADRFFNVRELLASNLNLQHLTRDLREAIEEGERSNSTAHAFEVFRRAYRPRREFNYQI